MTVTDDQLFSASLARLADYAPELRLDARDTGTIDRAPRHGFRVPFAVAVAALTLVGGTTYLLPDRGRPTDNSRPETTPTPTSTTTTTPKRATREPTQPGVDPEPDERGPSSAAVEAVIKILAADSQYGGVWVDGGVLHVRLKAGYDQARVDAARAEFRSEGNLIVHGATYTLRELRVQHRAFERHVPAMQREGIKVGIAGPVERKNRVLVDIHSDLEQARRYVREHLGDAPALELRAQTGQSTGVYFGGWGGAAP